MHIIYAYTVATFTEKSKMLFSKNIPAKVSCIPHLILGVKWGLSTFYPFFIDKKYEQRQRDLEQNATPSNSFSCSGEFCRPASFQFAHIDSSVSCPLCVHSNLLSGWCEPFEHLRFQKSF